MASELAQVLSDIVDLNRKKLTCTPIPIRMTEEAVTQMKEWKFVVTTTPREGFFDICWKNSLDENGHFTSDDHFCKGCARRLFKGYGMCMCGQDFA